MAGGTPKRGDKRHGLSTEKGRPDPINSVEIPMLPNHCKVPEADWRLYVDGRLARFESALESLVGVVDEDVKKKAIAMDQLRGLWMRILGEYGQNTRYEAFGIKAIQLMKSIWKDLE